MKLGCSITFISPLESQLMCLFLLFLNIYSLHLYIDRINIFISLWSRWVNNFCQQAILALTCLKKKTRHHQLTPSLTELAAFETKSAQPGEKMWSIFIFWSQEIAKYLQRPAAGIPKHEGSPLRQVWIERLFSIFQLGSLAWCGGNA